MADETVPYCPKTLLPPPPPPMWLDFDDIDGEVIDNEIEILSAAAALLRDADELLEDDEDEDTAVIDMSTRVQR